jgi:hypothetical protein
LQWTYLHKVSEAVRRPAVGCIAWLDVSFIVELFVHGEPAEVSTSALDALLCIELEGAAVEEWPGGKTGVGGNSRGADRTQGRLDALVEAGGNTTTGKKRDE